MALDFATLRSGLRDLMESPADSAAGCAQLWADAVADWAADVTPPSVGAEGGRAALVSGLATAFDSPDAAPGMESAFAAFAATVGGGMAPAFTAVPPPMPVGFAAKFSGPRPQTHSDAAEEFATLIDSWFRTGTAAPNPPGTVFSAWT